MDALPGIIMTVRGPIEPAACGVTSCHEHVIFDPGSGSLSDPNYDLIIYDAELQSEELALFRAAGGQSVVSVTNIGIGRDPLALQRISQAAGVHIVMATGWYRSSFYPA